MSASQMGSVNQVTPTLFGGFLPPLTFLNVFISGNCHFHFGFLADSALCCSRSSNISRDFEMSFFFFVAILTLVLSSFSNHCFTTVDVLSTAIVLNGVTYENFDLNTTQAAFRDAVRGFGEAQRIFSI
jgi:hypothetical protein